MKDYPAAHSMDTRWFAVDNDGNIGVFYSNEDGAVPRKISEDSYQGSLVECLPKNKAGFSQSLIEGHVAAQGAKQIYLRRMIACSHLISKFSVLLVLESESVLEELRPYIYLQFAGLETVVYVSECPSLKIKSLLESGKVLRGRTEIKASEWSDFVGIFQFGHDWCGIAAPYKRDVVPQNPLNLAYLPAQLKQQLSTTRFESTDFNETSEIQPIEHTDCQTWGEKGVWLDTKGERAEWKEVSITDEESGES
jgi:hypothetical protein